MFCQERHGEMMCNRGPAYARLLSPETTSKFGLFGGDNNAQYTSIPSADFVRYFPASSSLSAPATGCYRGLLGSHVMSQPYLKSKQLEDQGGRSMVMVQRCTKAPPLTNLFRPSRCMTRSLKPRISVWIRLRHRCPGQSRTKSRRVTLNSETGRVLCRRWISTAARPTGLVCSPYLVLLFLRRRRSSTTGVRQHSATVPRRRRTWDQPRRSTIFGEWFPSHR